jgi:hypothetical protein
MPRQLLAPQPQICSAAEIISRAFSLPKDLFLECDGREHIDGAAPSADIGNRVIQAAISNPTSGGQGAGGRPKHRTRRDVGLGLRPSRFLT